MPLVIKMIIVVTTIVTTPAITKYYLHVIYNIRIYIIIYY
jgi:hypothetical protein